ncbi:unnamed protein product [Paramecium sonneborni]|uniref:Uncharacterized protein n=1 Tax=Paramecium sonneborni TaxID=65129 RepID=A0A8S1M2R4_9CILI|nr:unnamed protein product [Paramecium sonneborni]
MNQQFNVQYQGNKSTRYNRLPNLTNNPYLNLSQELRNSRTNKNQAQSKQIALSNKKDDANNYYYHTTIYNVKENKDISKFSNNQQLTFAKYNEIQTKLLVSDFKKKVDAFLKKNNQNYKNHLISNKITSSIKELNSLQQIKNQELLNQSLCSNKYTITTEKKSMKTMEIFILGKNKLVTKQVISSELIQHRLLKQMESFLKDDKFNYDLKMTTMIDQYSEIVNKINEKAFTIKIPDKYVIQMSDYNEYYQIKEDSTDKINQNRLEIIADQIIQEIQQSKKTTPKILSHQTSELYEPIIQVIQTEPTIIQQELIQQETTDVQQIIPEMKISNKKIRQRKKTYQNKNEINQSQHSSVSEMMDSSLKNQVIKDNDDIKKKKKEKSKIIDQAKIEEQEQQDLIQKEIQLQNKNKIIKKLREFDHLFKPITYLRSQSENIILQTQEPIILTKPKEIILKTSSIGSINDNINLKEINEIIRIKRKQLYDYQQEQLRQEREQQQTIENFIQNKNNGQSKPLNIIVNGKNINELKAGAEFWDPKRNSPRSFTKQRQNINNLNTTDQPLQGQQQEINDNEQKNNMIEEQEQKPESTKILEENNPYINTIQQTICNSINNQQVINEKIISFEQNLKQQQHQDIFDILLASDSVYDVKIDDYKIGKPQKNQIQNLTFEFKQDQDKIVFIHQVLWRREIKQVISKLSYLNKLLSAQINSEDENIKDIIKIFDPKDNLENNNLENKNSQI